MKAVAPWIHSRFVDLVFVLGPPFGVLALVMAFPQWFGPSAKLTEVHWLVLVLLIDVAHVYSTIYRTYLDKEAVRHYRFELVWLPLIAFVGMVLLYNMSVLWFWRCLAYLAIFHFVRQQYGFMRLYQRKDALPHLKYRLDAIVVYATTIAPLLFWHLNYPRRFDWFVEDDMIGSYHPSLAAGVLALYAVLLVMYAISEVWLAFRGHPFNVPKNLLLAGTALSWYMGIVKYDGDVTFTLFNVVSHGIPYMALVWAFGRKKHQREGSGGNWMLRTFFTLRAVPLYIALLFVLAYVEEGFWNTLVWNEHRKLFAPFNALSAIDGHMLLSFVVPLLSLPQVTHYIIDAFIWRMRKDRDQWQRIVFGPLTS